MNTFSYEPTKYMPSGGGYCPLAMSGLDPALSWVCTSVSLAGGPVIVRGRHAGAAVVVSGPSALYSMAEVYEDWLDRCWRRLALFVKPRRTGRTWWRSGRARASSTRRR